jgi:hypothetical protein
MRAQKEMIAYFAEKIALRRADPQDDLISYVINAQTEGRILSDNHVNGTLRLLLIAGIDTTWSAIGACLWHLAQHEEDRRRVRSEVGLMTSAIEEFLRAYAPVTMAREVVKQAQIGGCTFKDARCSRRVCALLRKPARYAQYCSLAAALWRPVPWPTSYRQACRSCQLFGGFTCPRISPAGWSLVRRLMYQSPASNSFACSGVR